MFRYLWLLNFGYSWMFSSSRHILFWRRIQAKWSDLQISISMIGNIWSSGRNLLRFKVFQYIMHRSHETYGWFQAHRILGAVRACGPWEVRTKSPPPPTPPHPLAILWSHTCGRSTCFLHVVWQRDRKNPYEAWEISIRSVVRGHTGSGEARECSYGLYIPGQTWLCVIWPVRTTHWPPRQDCLRAFNGHKIFGRPCLKVVHAIWRPYGSKNLQNIVRGRTSCTVLTTVDLKVLSAYGGP